MKTFTVYIEYDPETKLFFGTIPELTGAYTQGETMEELRANLQEVLELITEETHESFEELPEFVGVMQVTIAG